MFLFQNAKLFLHQSNNVLAMLSIASTSLFL